MRFEILGPIRVHIDARELTVTRARERIVLATLLLHAGDPVPVALLTESVWGTEAPRNARNQLQGCVSRLRRRFAEAGVARQVIATDPAGYRADVNPESVDLYEFRRLRNEARTLARAGRPTEAHQRYRAALGLWRGPALTGVDSVTVRQAAAVLDEERVQTLAECLEIELAQGAAGELVPELTELVRQHPYREKIHAALMLALYRAGRQADALAAYRHARQLFDDELGAELGDELHQLHRAILNRDPALEPTSRPEPPAGAGLPVPRELPAPVAGFTGRAAALKALDDCLTDGTTVLPAPVVISAIAGTAGVGKTALAIHWAHRVAEMFPDGQLHLNLRGYAAGQPMRSVEALTALLRSLGVPPEQIPAEEMQAASLYRSRLAGRRVLVVLDNARTVDQVRPLLPGSAGCLVLVTSRDRLAGLVARDGARRVTLDVLTPDEADALLSQLLGPERVHAEPQATARLAKACAYLPLALRIAAAGLADHPHQTVAGYVDELVAGDRLAALQTGDDQESAVLTAFGLSYRNISTDAARLFRLLGLVPGPDVTPPAAAALLGTEPATARGLLDQLASAHLVEEHATGRYAFHDLLRDYARRLAGTEDGDDRCAAATQRLLDWYLAATDAAADRLYPHMLRLPPDPEPVAATAPELAEPPEAVAWLEAERSNLAAAVAHATEHGPRRAAWRLADRLRGYFLRSRHIVDWLTVATNAANAAERDGDPHGEAAARLSLGDLHLSVGRYQDAADHYTSAVGLAERGGWLGGQAAALGNLGIAHRDLGQLTAAAECHGRALALNQRTGRVGGQASNHVNLGNIAYELGDLRLATDHNAEGLALYRQRGSRDGEAFALASLGLAYHDLGRLDDAEECHRQGLALRREVADRVLEGATGALLAAVLRDRGRLAEARQAAEAAVDRVSGVEDRRYEAVTHNVLGSIHLRLGDGERALDCFQRALALSRETGVRLPELEALTGEAASHPQLGHHELSVAAALEAAERSRESGYRLSEGQALTVLAEIQLGQGAHGDARAQAHRALELHRKTGHRLGEARTLAVLGDLAHATGEPEAAGQQWRAARELFTEIGAAAPEDLPR